MVDVTFDMAQVLWHLVLILLYYLGSINPSCWMASSTTTLVFLRGLGLRLISRSGGIVGLNLIFDFIGGLVAGLLISVLFGFFRR